MEFLGHGGVRDILGVVRQIEFVEQRPDARQVTSQFDDRGGVR